MIPFSVGLCPGAGKSPGLEAKEKGASCPIVYLSNSQVFLWGVGARRDHNSLMGLLLLVLLMHFTDDPSQQMQKLSLKRQLFGQTAKQFGAYGDLRT